MYSSTIPPLDIPTDKDDKGNRGIDDLEWGGELDYSNPDNFKDTDNNQRI